MSSLVDFIARELAHPVSWAVKEGEVRDDSVRGAKFFSSVETNVMTASDGASILVRFWEADEMKDIESIAEAKPETHKLIEKAPPNLSGQLSRIAAVGMNAGRLQRMLAEMDNEDTVNVYVLKIEGGSYALAFEQYGQVGIVAGVKSFSFYPHPAHMRIWEA